MARLGWWVGCCHLNVRALKKGKMRDAYKLHGALSMCSLATLHAVAHCPFPKELYRSVGVKMRRTRGNVGAPCR